MDSDSLVRQAVGCLSKAVGSKKGVLKSAMEAYRSACDLLRVFEEKIFRKSVDCAERMGILSAVCLGESDYCIDYRNACSTVIDIESFFSPRKALG